MIMAWMQQRSPVHNLFIKCQKMKKSGKARKTELFQDEKPGKDAAENGMQNII